jgi:peptidoglycan hydrolase-like protein with peptidoglycan-binding domain
MSKVLYLGLALGSIVGSATLAAARDAKPVPQSVSNSVEDKITSVPRQARAGRWRSVMEATFTGQLLVYNGCAAIQVAGKPVTLVWPASAKLVKLGHSVVIAKNGPKLSLGNHVSIVGGIVPAASLVTRQFEKMGVPKKCRGNLLLVGEIR